MADGGPTTVLIENGVGIGPVGTAEASPGVGDEAVSDAVGEGEAVGVGAAVGTGVRVGGALGVGAALGSMLGETAGVDAIDG